MSGSCHRVFIEFIFISLAETGCASLSWLWLLSCAWEEEGKYKEGVWEEEEGKRGRERRRRRERDREEVWQERIRK